MNAHVFLPEPLVVGVSLSPESLVSFAGKYMLKHMTCHILWKSWGTVGALEKLSTTPNGFQPTANQMTKEVHKARIVCGTAGRLCTNGYLKDKNRSSPAIKSRSTSRSVSIVRKPATSSRPMWRISGYRRAQNMESSLSTVPPL